MAKIPLKTQPATAAAPKKEEEKKPDFNLNFINQAVDDLKGFEDINQATMAIPFIRILQALSPQLNKQKPEFIEGAEEGEFINTITKKVYGNALKCIVLRFERIYIEWRPNRGGFVGYHAPEHAEKIAVDHTFGNWKTESGNILSESYVYMLLIAGHEAEGPVVLSLSSSAIKMAKTWNKLMVTHVMENGIKARPYYLVWELRTEYMSNDKGNWYTPAVRFDGYINEQQYALLGQERKMLPSRQIDYTQIEARPQSEAEAEDRF